MTKLIISHQKASSLLSRAERNASTAVPPDETLAKHRRGVSFFGEALVAQGAVQIEPGLFEPRAGEFEVFGHRGGMDGRANINGELFSFFVGSYHDVPGNGVTKTFTRVFDGEYSNIPHLSILIGLTVEQVIKGRENLYQKFQESGGTLITFRNYLEQYRLTRANVTEQ